MEKEQFIKEINNLKEKCVFVRESDEFEFEFSKGSGGYNSNQILTFTLLDNKAIAITFEVMIENLSPEIPYPFFKVYADCIEVYNHPVHSYSIVTLYFKNEKISEIVMWHKHVIDKQ